jgi:hypothetical protein
LCQESYTDIIKKHNEEEKSLKNNIITAVTEYSKDFHNEVVEFNGENVIASPFGSWLLYASIASSLDVSKVDSETLASIEKRLKMSISDTREAVESLMKSVPESLKLALATWASSNFIRDDQGVANWIASQESAGNVDVSRVIPEQKEVDAWVDSNSLGLISQFPEIQPWVELITASVVALDIEWATDFDVVDAEPDSYWNQQSLLHSGKNKHQKAIYKVDGKLYFVHIATEKIKTRFDNQIGVISVIGETNLSPEEELNIALRIAADDNVEKVDPWDLELGNYGSFVISEEEQRISTPGNVTFWEATLPAWEANSKFELTGFGYDTIGKNIADSDVAVSATQIAVASYDRKGFKAAALTTMMVGRAAAFVRTESKNVRNVTAVFDKPYAAIVTTFRSDKYENIPLFTAWITTAKEIS